VLPRLDSALAQVDAASAALRALVDGPGPPAAGPIADVIRRRTAWLLAGPADVAVDIQGDTQVDIQGDIQGDTRGDVQGDGPGRAQADLVADMADIAELVLLAVHPAAPAARAHIAVRAQGQPTQIAVTLMPVRGGRGIGDPAAAEPALHGLAAALGAGLRVDFFRWQWQIRLALHEVQEV
jgi:hypothetical protein